MNDAKHDSIKKIFSLYITIFPPLALYIVGGTITYAQVGLVAVCMLCIYDMVGKKIILSCHSKYLSFYIIAVFINTIFLGYTSAAFSEILPRNILQMLYFAVALVFFNNYIDYGYFIKAFRFVSIASSLFLILQAIVLFIWGKYIPGQFTFLELARSDLSVEYYNRLVGYGIGKAYRVHSIFGEGAEFSQYVLTYLALIIFENNKKANMDKIIISLALLLGKSNLGIIMLAAMWILFFLKNRSYKNLSLFLIMVIVLTFIANEFGVFEIVKRRLFNHSDGSMGLGTSFVNRFNGYQSFVNMDRSFLETMFGNGASALPDNAFIPSNLGHLYCYGVFGAACFIMLICSCYIKGKNIKRRTVVLLTVIGFAANLCFYNFTLFTLAVMVSDFKEEDIHNLFQKKTI